MRTAICFWIGAWMANAAFAQPNVSPRLADSLKQALAVATADTSKVMILDQLTRCYTSTDLDQALKYGRQGRALADEIGFMRGKLLCSLSLGFIMARTNDQAEGLQMLMEASHFAEKTHQYVELARAYSNISNIYSINEDNEQALEYARKAWDLKETYHITETVNPISLVMGRIYKDLGKTDSAIIFLQKAYEIGLANNMTNYVTSSTYYLADAYARSGKMDQALDYYYKSVHYAQIYNTNYTLARSYQGLARIYEKIGITDSAVFYSKKALSEKETNPYYYLTVIDAASLLAQVYEQKQEPVQALLYYKTASAAKDSLFSIEKTRQTEKMAYQEKEREDRTQRRIEAQEKDFQSTIKFYALLVVLAVVLIFVFFLYRNNLQKQKANTLLEQQRDEIQAQRTELQASLATLQTTQGQLLQSEKLASLGELTAGIAHEIQNPLNFVNNFAEVSAEMLDELQEALANDDTAEAHTLAEELKGNLTKINHHGQRASGIVKSMLEHSRTSTGTKEPTNLNALADEYLRLAYHGLRAKDSNFNADYELIADPQLPKVNVVPQDMGRVLLNLINNAFYAVHEKAKSGIKDYQPKVVVSTSLSADKVEIRVSDNGTGIPDAIREKIFQPFFTTKPTGQGTGLGLSLSYDIVKALGGELKVASIAEGGTDLIVQLNISN